MKGARNYSRKKCLAHIHQPMAHLGEANMRLPRVQAVTQESNHFFKVGPLGRGMNAARQARAIGLAAMNRDR